MKEPPPTHESGIFITRYYYFCLILRGCLWEDRHIHLNYCGINRQFQPFIIAFLSRLEWFWKSVGGKSNFGLFLNHFADVIWVAQLMSVEHFEKSYDRLRMRSSQTLVRVEQLASIERLEKVTWLCAHAQSCQRRLSECLSFLLDV